MDDLGGYLLSIVSVSVVSAIVIGLVASNSANTAIIKMICGMFITITVVSPWLNVQLNDISNYFDSLHLETENLVNNGIEYFDSETSAIIKERTEEYIYNKAVSLGSTLAVTVELSDTEPYEPIGVVLKGSISPFNKRQLQKIIADELGVAEVNQAWS